eukprot:4168594-Heterocapsa_arctica.AAC.1
MGGPPSGMMGGPMGGKMRRPASPPTAQAGPVAPLAIAMAVALRAGQTLGEKLFPAINVNAYQKKRSIQDTEEKTAALE